MLFAVVATAAGAGVAATSETALEVVVHEVKEQPVEIALPQRPLVLPTGAPACGNLMAKIVAMGGSCP